MALHQKDRSKFALYLFAMLSVFFNLYPTLPNAAYAETEIKVGFRYKRFQTPLVPMFEADEEEPAFLNGFAYPYLGRRALYPRSYKRKVALDSTGSNMQFQETIRDSDLGYSISLPLPQYVKTIREARIQKKWRDYSTAYLFKDPTRQQMGNRGLEIDIPVRIKNKMFDQIFGGENVSLVVTGDITIDGGFRHEKRSEVRTAYTRGSDYNFKMNQTQRFRVEGRVGEKVTVSVDQDSERPFEFENTIKLKYDGYDDEIIQSIDAGNIALSLPATRFVSFSGKNSGLFGIKMISQVGNLAITTIASQEKGENQKMSITGGASEETKKIRDYEYVRNVYFFLDQRYRKQYFPRDSETGRHVYDPRYEIQDIEVYISAPHYEQRAQTIRGWAVLDEVLEKRDREGTLTPEDTSRANASSELHPGYFLRLDKSQYELEPYLGIIKLRTPVQESEVLAVAYQYGLPDDPPESWTTVGDLNFSPENAIILKIIKPEVPRPSNKTWKLMMRNIYYLGNRNIPTDGFELRVLFNPSSGDDEENGTDKDGKTISYLNMFGLDVKDLNGANKPDNLIDNDPAIFRPGEGVLEFPFHQPFFPDTSEYEGSTYDTGYKLTLPEDKYDFYNTTIQTDINRASRFYIEVKSKAQQTNFNLGINVIDNSEEVRLNGRELRKGSDYIIDYMTGSLTILAEEASNPSATLDISYQKNQLFQLEKKTLLGTRAEYSLWDNSFIGGTFIYMNERTLDQKVRVGQGPTRNMIWDLNTRLQFTPDFLTRAVDALPFIRTKQQSSLNIEAEIAQVLPNPNTLNNESTGDNDGVAYIDDFEAANRVTPLGVMRRAWTPASMPEDSTLEFGASRASKCGHMIWYNPWDQIPIKQIWPERDVNANVPQRVHVLSMEFDPEEAVDTSDVSSNWNGVMRALSSGYANQTESKFLEIWVKSTRKEGTVYIDIGQISEDAFPNYTENWNYAPELDTEDKLRNGIRNGLLDDDEDVGLDGMTGSSDWWDLNGDGERNPGREPFSRDDWAYTAGSYDYDQINGTENNGNDQAGRIPDTEDINGNGSLDSRNDYFEYSFPLDSTKDTKGYIQGGFGNEYNWRLYRIPLNDYIKKVGEPDLSLVEYVRIWLKGFTGKTTVTFAEINIVGNQWLEKGTYSRNTDGSLIYDEKQDSLVVTSVVNTHDNPGYNPEATGVSGVQDRIYKVVAKEQSLVLKVAAPLKAGSEGIVQKTVPQAMDFIHYDKMKMFVHGGGETASSITSFPEGKLEYFLRFGADDNNYYEYRSPVYAGWDERNHLELDLGFLASLKVQVVDSDTISVAAIDPRTGALGTPRELAVKDSIKLINAGKDTIRYRVIGNPSLTNIRQLTLGLKNIDPDGRDIGPAEGDTLELKQDAIEVWFNELRLSGVKKDRGMAKRIHVDLALADLLSLTADVDQKDADFHTISQRFGTGNNEQSLSYSGKFQIDKLFPNSWGLSLPINFNFAQQESYPKYLPGKDILYERSRKDDQDRSRSENSKQGYGISFRKTTRSKNFFIKHTLDKLSLTYNEAETEGSSSTMLKQTSKSQSGKVSFSVDFGKNKYFQPFQWLGKGPVIKKLSEVKFFYVPSDLSTNFSTQKSYQYSMARPRREGEDAIITDIQKFTINRNFKFGYKPFDSMDFDYNRSYASDMRNPVITPFEEIFSGNFGTNLDINQSFSAQFNPKFLSWLTTNLRFSSGFKWSNNLQQAKTGKSAQNNNDISATVNFDPNRMVKSLFNTQKSKTAGRRSRAPSRRQNENRSQTQKDKDKDKDEKKKPEKEGPFFLIKWLDIGSSKFQKMSGSYKKRISNSDQGLEDGLPSTDYQFGFTREPGLGRVEDVGERDSRYSENISYNLQSGINILQNLSLTLRYDASMDMSDGAQKNGGESQSWLKTDKFNTAVPEWSVRWSGLEKFAGIKKFVSRMSFDHQFSGDKKTKWTNAIDNKTNESFTRNFRPLVGMSLSLKYGVNATIKYNTTYQESKSISRGTGGNRSSSSDITFTANYSKSTGFRIPIPIWPFKNKEFKNNVDLSLNFSMSKQKSEQNRIADLWEPTDESERYTFKPSLTYSFSQRVRGGMHFEVGKNKSKRVGETSIQEFGINVNIAIRGN
ncbi:cell surface protein SprA [candidate division KSB1 bacterium]|nr:cell surface protein SprA [candidate division KSB1 bacterium]